MLATASEAEGAISTLSGVDFRGNRICVRRGNYHQSQNPRTSRKASNKRDHQSPRHELKHRPKAATHVYDGALASRIEQHILQPSSAAARLRAARGPFDRYSRTLRDSMAETTQVDHVGERTLENAFAAPALGASAASRDSKSESNPVRIRSLLNSGDQLPDWKKDQFELEFAQIVTDMLKNLSMRKKYQCIGYPFSSDANLTQAERLSSHSALQKPMDLDMIESKLRAKHYRSAREYEGDIRLMFQNLYMSSHPESNVCRLGKRIECVFDEKWAGKELWLLHVGDS